MPTNSNTRRIAIGPAISVGGTPDFVALLAFDDHKVLSRTLRLSARFLQPDLTDEQQKARAQGMIAGLWWEPGQQWWQNGDVLACVRLRFGSSPGIFRDVYADLREGEYNLPPCSSVNVAIAYRRAQAIQGGPDLEVGAEVADGESAESTPLVLTCAADINHTQSGLDTIAGIAGSRRCPVPPGAYAFDVRAGATGVVLRDYGGQGYGAPSILVERDWETGRHVPPTQPILLGRARDLVVWPVRLPVGNPSGNDNYWTPEITFHVR